MGFYRYLFKVYEKPTKHFVIIFFPYIKLSTEYYQENKEERLVKGIKIFQEKKKAKRYNLVVNDINLFLKKKKVKGVRMNVNTIKVSLKMKNKGG